MENRASDLTFDGAINITGSLRHENGRLSLLGHSATPGGQPESRTDPAALTQQGQTAGDFRMGTLTLKNTDFLLGSGARLNTVIEAESSALILGEPLAGTAFFSADVRLRNSELDINGEFNSSIQATNSTLTVASSGVTLGHSILNNSDMILSPGAVVNAPRNGV